MELCKRDRPDFTRFLRDILVPSEGPSSIPDDKVRRHVLRQETITFNIMAGESGKGAFILFPNNPGTVIGAHLEFNSSTSKYEYTQAITVAQDLRKSYSLARQTGCILTIKSSTLPSGVYALSGTFNAATYEGPPSELSDGKSIIPDYGKVLQITSNPHDKIGNVKVGEGITILALPVSWDQPYTRLSDEIASSDGSGGVFAIDDTASLNYFGGPGTYSGNINFATKYSQEIYRSNFDSNQVGMVRYYCKMNWSTSKTPTTNTDVKVFIRANLHSIDGSIIKSQLAVETVTPTPDKSNGTTYFSVEVNYPSFDEVESAQIIAATSLTLGTLSEYQLPYNLTYKIVDIYLRAASLNGNFPGVQSPTTIVVYEGVPKGATLTGSGYKNYELIPNQDLLRNLTTVYPAMDPQGLAYAKAVFAHREQLGLRTVWATPDYENRFQLFYEIASYHDDGDMAHAMAWGLKDIIRGIRRFVPTLAGWADQVIPGSGGILRGANAVADHFFGEAASGQLFSNSASGKLLSTSASGKLLNNGGSLYRPDTSSVIPMSVAMNRRTFAADNKLRLRGNTKALLEDMNLLRENGIVRVSGDHLDIGSGPMNPTTAIFFPALVVDGDEVTGGRLSGTQIYAIVDGDYSSLLGNPKPYKTGEAVIWGVKNIGDNYPSALTGGYTVLPIRRIQGNRIYIDPSAPMPEGSSMQTAIAVISMRPKGLIPAAFTGAVYESGQIEPNKYAHLKKQGMGGYDLPLIANSAAADIRINTLKEAVDYAETSGKAPNQQYQFKVHRGARAFSASWINKFEDLFEEVLPDNPRFAKVRDVAIWLMLIDDDDHTTLDGLHDYSRADPRGHALKKVVMNSLRTARAKGPRQEDNVAAKVAALVNKIRLTGFPATEEWVRANGNRGPTTEQIRLFQNMTDEQIRNGELPPPQKPLQVSNSLSEEVVDEIAEKVYVNSFANAKRISDTDKQEIRKQLHQIASERGRITDADTRRLKDMYILKRTSVIQQVPVPRTVLAPTKYVAEQMRKAEPLNRVRPRETAMEPGSSLESVEINSPPPNRPRNLRFLGGTDELI